jgi:hypothetical protein
MEYRSGTHIMVIGIFTCFGSFSQGFLVNYLNTTLGIIFNKLEIVEDIAFYQVYVQIFKNLGFDILLLSTRSMFRICRALFLH